MKAVQTLKFPSSRHLFGALALFLSTTCAYAQQVIEGEKAILVSADLHPKVNEQVVKNGPELFAEWQKYISDYKPDYSDSSHYLQPPLQGRLHSPRPLAAGGKAQARINLPAEASQPLALAGRELGLWLKAVTGATFPVAQANAIAPPVKLTAANKTHLVTQIYLGVHYAAGRFDADIQWLGDTDGFAVRTRDNGIYIFGATDKGTLNGVYAFLENNTDIIWPRPQPELSAVYTRTSVLKAVWANRRDKPQSRLRGWGTNMGLRPENEIWSVRNRCNYPLGGGFVPFDGIRRAAHGDYVEYGGGHNISGFLGKRKEFFPMIDGVVPDTFDIWRHQPNFTAPGIEDAVAQNVIDYIKREAPPHIDCININIEDNWGVSMDPKSLEPIKLPDGTLLKADDPAFRSTQFFIFLNAVTRKIHEVYPDLEVGTYAYFFTAVPPRVALDPGIRIYFCPYVRKDHRSPLAAPINAQWWSLLEGWSKITHNLVMREYYGIANGMRPLAEVVAFDVRSYLQRGVRDFTAEMNPDEKMIWEVLRGNREEWDYMAMEFWVINRIYWNPNQDMEQLRRYYLRRTYHEVAPQMEHFFGIIRSQWYQLTNPSEFENPVGLSRSLIVESGQEETMRGLLGEAAVAIKNPTSRLAVLSLRHSFDEWVRAAKNPEQANPEKTPSATFPLYYGWRNNTDWGDTPIWASTTMLEVNGKARHVVRVTTMASRAPKVDMGTINTAVAEVKGLQNGMTFTCTILPAHPNEALPGVAALKLEGLRFSLTDNKDVTVSAPPEAFETQPDGSVNVRWKIVSGDSAFDASQLKNMQFIVPNAAAPVPTEAILYLADMDIQ